MDGIDGKCVTWKEHDEWEVLREEWRDFIEMKETWYCWWDVLSWKSDGLVEVESSGRDTDISCGKEMY